MAIKLAKFTDNRGTDLPALHWGRGNYHRRRTTVEMLRRPRKFCILCPREAGRYLPRQRRRQGWPAWKQRHGCSSTHQCVPQCRCRSRIVVLDKWCCLPINCFMAYKYSFIIGLIRYDVFRVTIFDSSWFLVQMAVEWNFSQ
jgi:hypothetical protein